MKNGPAENQNRSHNRLVVYVGGIAAAFAVLLSQPAHADEIIPPPVPGNIAVPEGNVPFLVGHAFGTQNYICLPAGKGVAYALFTPEATLLGDDQEQVTTHFFSPNPFETNANPAVTASGAIRATWQHSRDGSSIWAQVKPGNASTDPAFVAPGAVAWLLLTKVGVDAGAAGGDILTKTTFVQRLNTSGGVAPSTGCNSQHDIGHQAFMPYTADYFFFTAR